MTPQSAKKMLVAIYVVTGVVLAVVWAANGYEDTWLYIWAALIGPATSWFYLKAESKDQ